MEHYALQLMLLWEALMKLRVCVFRSVMLKGNYFIAGREARDENTPPPITTVTQLMLLMKAKSCNVIA